MTAALRELLSAISQPVVFVDYANYVSPLNYALGGFELPESVVDACGPTPQSLTTHFLKDVTLWSVTSPHIGKWLRPGITP